MTLGLPSYSYRCSLRRLRRRLWMAVHALDGIIGGQSPIRPSPPPAELQRSPPADTLGLDEVDSTVSYALATPSEAIFINTGSTVVSDKGAPRKKAGYHAPDMENVNCVDINKDMEFTPLRPQADRDDGSLVGAEDPVRRVLSFSEM